MEIAIIGAGAGGLAAALNACHHAHVTLYDLAHGREGALERGGDLRSRKRCHIPTKEGS